MENTIRYRKIGGGSLRWKGKIIKPNEVFSALPDEIPEAFRRHLVAIDPEPEEAPFAPVQKLMIRKKEPSGQDYGNGEDSPDSAPDEETVPDGDYLIQPKGVGWFEIVNTASGKVINEKSLRKADAEKLLQELVG